MLVVWSLVASVVGLGYLVGTPEPAPLAVFDGEGMIFALTSGLFFGIGTLFYYLGPRFGKVSTVSAFSGMYFVVTAVLGVIFLGESMDAASDLTGVLLAVGAALMLAR